MRVRREHRTRLAGFVLARDSMTLSGSSASGSTSTTAGWPPFLARLVLLASIVTLTGCGLIGGAPAARSLAIDLRVPRSEAVRRTLTAFREQGYTVRASLTSGLNPETEPFRQGDAEAVFRAEISGSGSSSRVVLSGSYHTRELGGIVRSGEHEVRNGDDPLERALWSRLEQLRLAIRLE
jgi:hypothetical protein